MPEATRKNKPTGPAMCREIARDVYCLEVGKGLNRSNVYFLRSGPSWVLVDAASANYGWLIQRNAESLFGAGTPPALILLTHYHPDHAGSALELASKWGCPVLVHPDELPFIAARDLASLKKYANPLDRWMVLPLLRLMPRRRMESILLKDSLKSVAQGFDISVGVPGLADWQCIPAPGHTPGHMALYRAADRTLITGDAIVTVDINSFRGFLFWCLRLNKPQLCGPPWYSTLDSRSARKSVAVLAALEPRIVASGHGPPMQGAEVALDLRVLADRVGGRPA